MKEELAKILTELRHDAGRARKTIAASLSISEASLSKKIAILKDEGIIRKETIDIDYGKAGYPANGFTLLKIDHANKTAISDLIGKAAKLDQAIEVASIFGDWDIYIRWMAADPNSIMACVNETIDDPRIEDTQTVILGNLVKRESGPAFIKKG